jgi:Carboxypeptidase regulatory-like domain
MKTRLLLCVLAIAVSSASQEKGKYAGFTKSPTEHIINELKQPFEVESIRGVVTREEGEQEPLQNVLVEIKGSGDHDKIRRAKTDEHGQFKISHVPAGTYTFKTTLNGFQSVVGTIIVSKKAAKDSRIKIAMLIGV